MLAVGVATVAIATTAMIPVPISAVTVAVLIGIVIGNLPATRTLQKTWDPGTKLASERLLRIGVALLGAQLHLESLATVGGRAVLLVAITISSALAIVSLIARFLGVAPKDALLLAVGTAVCGNTAIMATAPIIRANERAVSYAVGTITLLGTISMLTLPAVAAAIGMDSTTFGIWAGLAINDTSQVVAAGSAFSGEARDVATIVKLTRNAAMAPLLIIMTIAISRQSNKANDGRSNVAHIRASFPTFVLGFVALAALRTFGVIPDSFIAPLDVITNMLIVTAIAAVGVRAGIQSLRVAGSRPLIVALIGSVALVAIAYLLATST